MRKPCRTLFRFGVITLFLALALILGAKFYVEHQAKNIAAAIIQETLPAQVSQDETIIALARAVFTKFTPREPSEIPALRLRPYITNARLPKIFKLQDGAIETIIQTGLCDNAARMLSFLLKQRGIQSVQWNMVTHTDAHSALNVTLADGRNVFIDPFYGYAAFDKNKNALMSAQEAQNRLKAGAKQEDVFFSLTDQSHPEFYRNFATAFMAAQGTALEIMSTLPALTENTLVLGEINGNSEDVKTAAGQHNMTPFWNYVGHKYNREWVRTLTAPQDVTLTMILTNTPESGLLTSTPLPRINGNQLSWDLKGGDKIIFKDGLAKISFTRMNSYIDVDQIIIKKAE